jgi:hypothetical protein
METVLDAWQEISAMGWLPNASADELSQQS